MGKKRKRQSTDATTAAGTVNPADDDLPEARPSKKAKGDKGDAAPPTVANEAKENGVPQTKAGKQTPSKGGPGKGAAGKSTPNKPGSAKKKNPKKKRFVYGNYDRYYGYRNHGQAADPRMDVLPKDLFEGKRCLDIGCNVGQLTIQIAEHYAPTYILGCDIDDILITRAKKNLRRLVSRKVQKPPQSETATEKAAATKEGKGDTATQMKINEEVEKEAEVQEEEEEFPISFAMTLGPVVPPQTGPLHGGQPMPSLATKKEGKEDAVPEFPFNVEFRTENFVQDAVPAAKEQFDVVLCLSVSKWVHLNWGDAGLMALFNKVHDVLAPGGSFILEPQPWSSYKKKCNVSETTLKNFRTVAIRPTNFNDILLTEVGFREVRQLHAPAPGESDTFKKRPIFVYTK